MIYSDSFSPGSQAKVFPSRYGTSFVTGLQQGHRSATAAMLLLFCFFLKNNLSDLFVCVLFCIRLQALGDVK